jgi:ATP/maltotriose-dependent transcriptional regulator MalT
MIQKNEVKRAKALAFLQSVSASRLIILRAPAGFGKTSLARQWFDARLGSLVQGCWSDIPHESERIRTIRDDIFDSIDEGARFVVIDGAEQNIPKISEVIHQLLEMEQEDLTVLITTREPLSFDVFPYLTEDRIVECGPELLVFSREEISQFFPDGSGEDLREKVELAHRLTAGWPVAVKLICKVLRNSTPNPDSEPEILQDAGKYIVRQVWPSLSDIARQIVRICARHGHVPSEALFHGRQSLLYGGKHPDADFSQYNNALDQAQESMCILPDSDGYRIHPLLRGIPLPASESVEEESSLSLILYYLSKGRFDLALTCDLRSGRSHLNCICEKASLGIIDQSQIRKMIELIHCSLNEGETRSASIQLFLSAGNLTLGNIESSEMHLKLAKEACGSLNPRDRRRSKLIEAFIALSKGDLPTAERLAVTVEPELGDTEVLNRAAFNMAMAVSMLWMPGASVAESISRFEHAARYSRAGNNIYSSLSALLQSAIAMRLSGDFNGALHRLEEISVSIGKIEGLADVLTVLFAERSAIYREWHNFESAQAYAERSQEHASFCSTALSAWWAECELVAVQLSAGEYKQAAASLRNLDHNHALKTVPPWFLSWGLALKAELHIARNDRDAFVEWLSAYSPFLRGSPDRISAFSLISEARGRYAFSLQPDSEWQQLVQSASADLKSSGLKYLYYRLELGRLMLAMRNDRSEDMFANVSKILDHMLDLKLNDSLTFYSTAIAGMGGRIENALRRRILALVPAVNTSRGEETNPPLLRYCSGEDIRSPEAPVESLSPRELEVLKALASGLTNNQLADTLFVSRNTIKTHLKHMYAKLNVSNRIQAVAWARKEGLLSV